MPYKVKQYSTIMSTNSESTPENQTQNFTYHLKWAKSYQEKDTRHQISQNFKNSEMKLETSKKMKKHSFKNK